MDRQTRKARKATGTSASTNQPLPSSNTTFTPPVSASPNKARKSIARHGSAPIGTNTNQSAPVVVSTVSQTPVTKRSQARKSTGGRKPVLDNSNASTQKGISRNYSNGSSSVDTQDTTAIFTQSRDVQSSDSETEIKGKRRMSALSFATTTQLSTSGLSQPGTSSRRSSSDSDDFGKSVTKRQVLKRKSRKINKSTSEDSDSEYVPPDQNIRKGKSSLPTPIQKVNVSMTQDENRKTKAMKFNSSFNSTNESERALSQGNILKNLVNKCVFFILVADQKKHAIKKSEIMKHVFENQNSKLYSTVMGKANNVLQKTFGLEILEINDQNNSYILINILDPDHELGIRDFAEYSPQELQKRGFIFYLLTIIFMNENAITEEDLWKALEPLNISSNSRVPHPVFGDVKKLLTVELVKQMYLKYTCISKDPPQFEFVWGERAVQEVSKEDLLEFACKMMGNTKPQDWILQYNDAKAKPTDAEG